jgi:hypothetical protein
MRPKACFGQFQNRRYRTRNLRRLISLVRLRVELLLAMSSRAGRITMKGFVTSSRVAEFFLDGGNGSGQPPSVIGVVIYFPEGNHSLGLLAHLGMASPSHVH